MIGQDGDQETQNVKKFKKLKKKFMKTRGINNKRSLFKQ